MTRTWAARALLALALSALLLPALAGPASAGEVTKDSLPSVAQVAKVYPFLADSGRDLDPGKRIDTPGRDCNGSQDKNYRGTSGLTAYYGLVEGGEDAAHPMVVVQTIRLRSTRQAKAVARAFLRFASTCRQARDEDGSVSRISRFRVGRLGDQQVGMTMRAEDREIGKMSMRWIVVRTKSVITTVFTFSLSSTPPSAPKAIRLAKIAVEQAR
jgi:hypothetical protein